MKETKQLHSRRSYKQIKVRELLKIKTQRKIKFNFFFCIFSLMEEYRLTILEQNAKESIWT
jgi:hypothetical protein